jgi:hypothetical protein
LRAIRRVRILHHREDSAEYGRKRQDGDRDHIAIAREIAGEVNLGPNIVSADSFLEKNDNEAQSVVRMR